jgi:hypothetical protein
MKKFFSFPAKLAFAAILLIGFASCQKDQAATTTDDASNSGTESRVVGTAGAGTWAGSIPPDYAAALAANYADKYDDRNQTQYVAFSIKDLSEFLSNLKAKYKSDLVYVNFGVYGKGAKPVDGKDWGRLTVFLTGNKIPAPSSSKKTDGLIDDLLDEFLNHGQIYP